MDNEVIVESADKMKIGNFYDVKIVDIYEYDLFAQFEATGRKQKSKNCDEAIPLEKAN
ncbi:MAG: hypothetical protein QME25_02375 [Bacteroidota bacterium]|nr:hypothetical protein [Bacteroidota bacterium]